MAEAEQPSGHPEELNAESHKTEDVKKISPFEQDQQIDTTSGVLGEEKDNDMSAEKHEPGPADEGEREVNESVRVKEAKRWNNRDRQENHRGERNGRARGHGRFNNDRYQKFGKLKHNNKFDPASLPKTDDPHAIRKQVEFYFSDSNLLTDKFLFTKIEGHKNLPVPIDTIHSFKRMQRFQPRSAIVDALKESKTVQLVNEENDIQRKEALSEGLEGKEITEIQKVHEDESMARSIYAKGFGTEEASTQFDIEAFFANHGATNSVRLRRATDGNFKGSVFVEFDSEATAKAFAASDPRPSYRGKELIVKTKKEYCDDKVEDIKAGRVRPNSPDGRSGGGGPKSARQDRNGDDNRDWRQRRHEDAEDGFPNRRDKMSGGRGRGKHRGFGRGGRGGQSGPRERNEEKRREEEQSLSTGHEKTGAQSTTEIATEGENAAAGEVAAGALSGDGIAGTTPKENAGGDDASKKRSREDDDGTEDTRETKKVDAKEGPEE